MRYIYQQTQNMGDISSLMQSMGAPNIFLTNPNQVSDITKKILIVIDSMTNEERDKPEKLRDESRRRRISR